MKYNELTTTRPKQAKRVGRGISAGQGKTAGRGTKGQGARTGSKKKPGFAGGSNPLMQKLPKLPGFKSHKTKSEVVYTGQIGFLKPGKVDAQVLADEGLISNAYVKVKIVVKGELSKKYDVSLPSASEAAKAMIESAGGSFSPTKRLSRPKTSTKTES
jgi:large subunit ribosomal protein L15